MKPTEKQIQQAILTYLLYRQYLVWRNNSGMVTASKGYRVKLGKTGSPDIIGMTKTGRFLGIEVKNHKNKQQQSQVDFETQVKTNNGIYLLVHSYEEFLDKFREFEGV